MHSSLFTSFILASFISALHLDTSFLSFFPQSRNRLRLESTETLEQTSAAVELKSKAKRQCKDDEFEEVLRLSGLMIRILSGGGGGASSSASVSKNLAMTGGGDGGREQL